ncbi:MAG: hypothetical protein HQL63_11070 [Magnetococcales bacterium]|nr:hypothetical protein [Magnetococcales bacterium]
MDTRNKSSHAACHEAVPFSHDARNVSRRESVLYVPRLDQMRGEFGIHFFDFIRGFQAKITLHAEMIRLAARENDTQQVAKESHHLKNLCEQICLHQMGALAAQIESIALTGNLQGIKHLVEKLIRAGLVAHVELTKFCSSCNKLGRTR